MPCATTSTLACATCPSKPGRRTGHTSCLTIPCPLHVAGRQPGIEAAGVPPRGAGGHRKPRGLVLPGLVVALLIAGTPPCSGSFLRAYTELAEIDACSCTWRSLQCPSSRCWREVPTSTRSTRDAAFARPDGGAQLKKCGRSQRKLLAQRGLLHETWFPRNRRDHLSAFRCLELSRNACGGACRGQHADRSPDSARPHRGQGRRTGRPNSRRTTVGGRRAQDLRRRRDGCPRDRRRSGSCARSTAESGQRWR
jgi:hypothetical protein